MPKVKSQKSRAIVHRDPLGNEIAREPGQFRAFRKTREDDELKDEDDDIHKMPEALSRKIMHQARSQRLEEMKSALPRSMGPSLAITRDVDGDTSEDEDQEDDEVEEEELSQEGDLVEFDEMGGTVGGTHLSEAEERVVNAFLFSGAGERRTLSDIIMEKIQEKTQQMQIQEQENSLPPKVQEVYSGVGNMLKTYRSGKLPKALKMLPHLQNWEQVLWITRPDEWSPHAVFACTRIFASNLNTKMAQRFYNLVLLERCREDIRSNKRLNYHLYMALKKAIYKPGAFYKGVILPLAQEGSCTLREATIIASVMAKVSIPPQHSAAALVKLCDMPYSGSNSLFIRVLLNKKYALPRRCIDALVRHFASFENETRQLPVCVASGSACVCSEIQVPIDR